MLQQVLLGRYADGLGNVVERKDRIGFQSFPHESTAICLLSQLKRWGIVAKDLDIAASTASPFGAPDRRGKTMKGYHDIGGEPAGAIEKTELPWLQWEKQVEAVRNLLGDATRRVLSLDELRLGFESFGADKYRKYSFYRRRLEAMIDTLEKKGLITRAEVMAEVEDARRRSPAPAAKDS